MPIFCLLGMLSGCASSNPVDIPDWNIDPIQEEVQAIKRLPPLPPASDLQCLAPEVSVMLLDYSIVAGGIYDVAVANTEGLVSMNQAYNDLAHAGQLQKNFTLVRDEQLAESRRAHFIDNLWHRAVIVVLAIGLML